MRFTQRGWEDYCSWVGDRKLLTRVHRLVYTFEDGELVVLMARFHYR
jgi:Txe/YoeB family toxin of Txe-Axe toxin-antitoxin module